MYFDFILASWFILPLNLPEAAFLYNYRIILKAHLYTFRSLFQQRHFMCCKQVHSFLSVFIWIYSTSFSHLCRELRCCHWDHLKRVLVKSRHFFQFVLTSSKLKSRLCL
ncbi:hypothetical protein Cni_G17510 [Canna indica]|uniref:Uncharacterized protein n=1 Tax=Canna indica TaxID=4628 RepID=A0AAQ3KHJ7_9LILI|nr:hypothetical protein Cni_G17510 [Canna indica]